MLFFREDHFRLCEKSCLDREKSSDFETSFINIVPIFFVGHHSFVLRFIGLIFFSLGKKIHALVRLFKVSLKIFFPLQRDKNGRFTPNFASNCLQNWIDSTKRIFQELYELKVPFFPQETYWSIQCQTFESIHTSSRHKNILQKKVFFSTLIATGDWVAQFFSRCVFCHV
jgi:hypothetical protein